MKKAFWLALTLTLCGVIYLPAGFAQSTSESSPEAERFKQAKQDAHSLKKKQIVAYALAVKNKAQDAWAPAKTQDAHELLISKVRLIVDADGKLQSCEFVSHSKSTGNDDSISASCSSLTFEPFKSEMKLEKLNVYLTFMTDGQMSLVEFADLPEAKDYYMALIDRDLAPNGAVDDCAKLGAYMTELKHRIIDQWLPPLGDLKRVAIDFDVTQKGAVLNAKVARSSGSSADDKAALNAVLQAAPFATLPKGSESSMHFELNFDDKLRKADSHRRKP